MRKLLIPLGLAVLLGIVTAAFIWDCVRAANDIEKNVALVDADLIVQEDRLSQSLAGWTDAPAEVKEAMEEHRRATSRQDRHAAYDHLVEAVNKGLADAAKSPNPPSNELKDGLAGAMNRRRVAERRFREEESLLKGWESTFRGRVAKVFVSPSD